MLDTKKEPILKSLNIDRIRDGVPFLLALILALIVAAFLLLALDANPLVAFASMWEGAFGSENATAETLVKATPILFVAIGITVAFRGGVINIGGEGQMIAGAVVGVWVTLFIGESMGVLVVPIALIAGFLAGDYTAD